LADKQLNDACAFDSRRRSKQKSAEPTKRNQNGARFSGLPDQAQSGCDSQSKRRRDFSSHIGIVQTRNTASDMSVRSRAWANGSLRWLQLPKARLRSIYCRTRPLSTSTTLSSSPRRNYFNGITIHRVVPNFVIQDGDPRGDGNGGPGYQIRCEINEVPYERGAVGMALSGKDTGGSQWFVTHSPQPSLDGGYTVFVTSSPAWT